MSMHILILLAGLGFPSLILIWTLYDIINFDHEKAFNTSEPRLYYVLRVLAAIFVAGVIVIAWSVIVTELGGR